MEKKSIVEKKVLVLSQPEVLEERIAPWSQTFYYGSVVTGSSFTVTFTWPFNNKV